MTGRCGVLWGVLIFLLAAGCGTAVLISEEEVRLNRRAGQVLAPAGINEYFVGAAQRGRILAAWTEVTGERLSLELAILDASSLALVARGGRDWGNIDALGPELVEFHNQFYALSLLRGIGGSSYDLYQGVFDRDLREIESERVSLKGRPRGYGLFRSGEELFSYWIEPPGYGFHLRRLISGGWRAVEGPWANERVIGEPAILPSEDEAVVAWWNGKTVKVARSDGSRTSGLPAMTGQPVLVSDAEGLRVSLVSIGEEEGTVRFSMASSGNGGRNWESSEQSVEFRGRRPLCRGVSGPNGENHRFLICTYWDVEDEREVGEIFSLSDGEGGFRIGNQSEPPRPRVFDPEVRWCADQGFGLWQERVGKESRVLVVPLSEVRDLGGARKQELMLTVEERETVSMPKIICVGGLASIAFFRAKQERGPMPRFGVRGDLIITRMNVGWRLPQIW